VLANGGEVPDGLLVLHCCDEPGCCRPDHLYLGNYADNLRDCIRRGRFRQVRGERSGRARLTERAVLEIRARVAAGGIQTRLPERYGVSESAVRQVARGETWAHVGGARTRGRVTPRR
jgi:HNH endonuclease